MTDQPGRPVIVVIAAGPGVSGSLARRCAREGYDVGLVGHDDEALKVLSAELGELGANVGDVVADITDAAGARVAIDGLAVGLGRVDWLHFNPSAFRQQTPLVLSSADLLTDVGLGVGALLTALQAVRPYMSAGGRITATGAGNRWRSAVRRPQVSTPRCRTAA